MRPHDQDDDRTWIMPQDADEAGEVEHEPPGDDLAQRPGLNRLLTSRTRDAMEVRYFGRELFPHRESIIRLDSSFVVQPSIQMARRFIPSVYSTTDFGDTPYFDPRDSLSYGASSQLYRNENFSSRPSSPTLHPMSSLPASLSTAAIPIVELSSDHGVTPDRPDAKRSTTDTTIQRSVSDVSSSYIGASIASPYKPPPYYEEPPFQEPLYRGPARRQSARQSESFYRVSFDGAPSSAANSPSDKTPPALDEPPLPVVEPLRLLPQPPPPLSASIQGARFYMIIGTLCLMNFLLAIESTSITVALPTIAQKANLSTVQAFWLGTSSLLTATVIQPLFNSLSQMFGRRSMAIASLFLLAIGSVLGGAASNARLLLAARSVQGLGSGGCLTLTYALMTDLVSLKDRGKWFGIVSVSWAIGTILGPMIGGAFAEERWQWIFWINLPFCGLAILASFLTLDLPTRFPPAFTGLWLFDWAGMVVLSGSITATLIAISWGGATFRWGAPEVVVALFVGLLGLVAFVIHLFISPAYSRALPLLRPRLFASGTSAGSYLLTITHGMILYAIAYMLPIYHQVRGKTPLESAVSLLPITLSVVPSAIIVGLVISKMGQYYPFVWIGWILMLLGTGFFMALNTHTETVDFVLVFIPCGVGLGMVISSLSYATLASAFSFDLPWATGTFAFCRTLGGAFGVAAAGVAFQNEFLAQMKKSDGFADKANEWTVDLVGMIMTIVNSSGEEKEAIIDGYVDGLFRVWMLLCVISAVSLALSVFLIREKRFIQRHGQAALNEKPAPPPSFSSLSARPDSSESISHHKREDCAV